MRKFDVAYNPPLPDGGERKKTLEEMTLDELAKRIGGVCAKCHGDYTICEGCRGCVEGRMLVDKLNGEPKDKMSGVRKMYHLNPAQKQEEARKLYREALMSDDPIKYIMEKCGVDKASAKKRFSVYKKKYHYDRDKVAVEKAFGKASVEPKKMVDITPKREKTVPELIKELEKERNELVKRLSEIDSALTIIRGKVG